MAQLASIRLMSGQVSRGLAGDYQSDERASYATKHGQKKKKKRQDKVPACEGGAHSLVAEEMGTANRNPGRGNGTALGNPCLASVKGLSQMAFC